MIALSPPRPSPRAQVIALFVAVLVCFAAAGVGGLASANSPEFYRRLDRPAFAPPGWVFGPVWTVLYLMQAAAVWLVWREAAHPGRRIALALFGVQLTLNALWTWIFFAFQSGAGAFVEILVLDVALLATVAAFWRVRRPAAVLMLPYLAWVSFATVLTYSIWQRNPQWLG
jgi:benzodiazapine receptor